MAFEPNGALVPIGGGDPIPLIRPVLSIGRRESCDICMRFSNVSGIHCELAFHDGVWYVRDLNSTNGIKVNGKRVQKKVLHPGDVFTIAKRQFKIDYVPSMQNRMDDMLEDEEEDILSKPLLERAGLAQPKRDQNRKQRRSQE